MEKKQIRNLIILASLVALLIAAFFIGRHLNKVNDENEQASDEAKEISFVTVSVNDVDKVSYLVYGDQIRLTRKDDCWYAGAVSLNAATVSSMVDDFNSATASQVITGNDINLDTFGLSAPSNVITLTDKEGKTQVFNIGIQNKITDQFYMYLDNDKTKVYMIGPLIPNSFEKGTDELTESSDTAN